MAHRYSIGATVRFDSPFPAQAGVYTVVRQMPIERDDAVRYRIKSAAESFERTADEYQLSPLS